MRSDRFQDLYVAGDVAQRGVYKKGTLIPLALYFGRRAALVNSGTSLKVEIRVSGNGGQVMHKTVSRFLGVMITLAAVNAAAQVAGSLTLGVPATELVTLAKGWSAKNQILGKLVYNEKDEKVGQVDDIIVTPDKAVSYAILGVGGFLGLGEREIAIPFKQLKAGDGKFMLRGATKDALKGLPAFSYAK